METRSRLVSTTLLVLVALGGAGLAVAADRPHNPDGRPELTWVADQKVRPWLDQAGVVLARIDAQSATAARSGRDALARLQAQDLDGVRDALTQGADAIVPLDEDLFALGGVLAGANTAVERWRLGETTAGRLDRVNLAGEASNAIIPLWARIEERATTVSDLIDALTRHDAQVFRSTTAGRQSQWQTAVDELRAATPILDEARAIRDRLASVADTETLTQLLDRYGAYDAALLALYEHIAETGEQSGREFERLEAAVDAAQQALPPDSRALSVIVGETAGTAMAQALVELERARGDIRDAVDEKDAGE